MQKLVSGLHHFQEKVFDSKKELFERLGKGQSPETLFITCSDSRIDPNLIMQTEPGELFIIRNAGNIVPPEGAPIGGEAATIEYAITALGVKDIIICGHSHCGAMAGLLKPEALTPMPSVKEWLAYAKETTRIIDENYSHLEGDSKLKTAIQENVLVQLENLKTLPVVAERIEKEELNLHGWVYKIETGEIFNYDSQIGQFVPLRENQAPIAWNEDRIVRA
jgi:carbonic anhydrase